jgi:hypothetical protein
MKDQDQELQKGTYDHDVAIHVWMKQVGETPLAYNLFSVFRDAGFNRDLKETAKDLGRKYQSVRNLSISNQWVMRVASYDEHIRLETERKLQYEIIEARRRHHRLGAMMMDFAQESIENLRSCGDLLTVRDVVTLTECGHKIESTALGMSSEITESRIAADIQVAQKETIPVEILERIGKEIAAAKSAGEDVEDIAAQFEELATPELLAPGNGNGEKISVKA